MSVVHAMLLAKWYMPVRASAAQRHANRMHCPKFRSNGTPPTGEGNETLVEDILEREIEEVNRMKWLERMLASLHLQPPR